MLPARFTSISAQAKNSFTTASRSLEQRSQQAGRKVWPGGPEFGGHSRRSGIHGDALQAADVSEALEEPVFHAPSYPFQNPYQIVRSSAVQSPRSTYQLQSHPVRNNVQRIRLSQDQLNAF
jgi:hypothetical protein